MMKPGWSLDALVAEKVMKRPPPPDYMPFYSPPPYSTDIAAAWEVVEKLRARPAYVTIGEDFNGTGWECEVFEDEDTLWAASSDTAPHAICLAALKVVGALE